MARNLFGFLAKNKPVQRFRKTNNIPGANWLKYLGCLMMLKSHGTYHVFLLSKSQNQTKACREEQRLAPNFSDFVFQDLKDGKNPDLWQRSTNNTLDFLGIKFDLVGSVSQGP